MKNSFHNSTNETGANLQRFEAAAQSQETKVLDYFKAHPGGLFTSEHIFLTLFYDPKFPLRVPISSTRRALSNLKREGFIEKTDEKKTGSLSGRSGHLYKLVGEPTLF